jgi:hypothetical protein
LGSNPSSSGLAEFAAIDSTYVSRQQLVVTEILGQVYFFLPPQATLSALNSNGELLTPLQLYPLNSKQMEILRLGVDPQQGLTEALQGPPSDFAILEIILEDDSHTSTTGTPRPRAAR